MSKMSECVNNYKGIYDPNGFFNIFYSNSKIYISKSVPKDYKRMKKIIIYKNEDKWLWETTGTHGATLFYIQRKNTK